MVKCPRCGFEFEPSAEQKVPVAGSQAAQPIETEEQEGEQTI